MLGWQFEDFQDAGWFENWNLSSNSNNGSKKTVLKMEFDYFKVQII